MAAEQVQIPHIEDVGDNKDNNENKKLINKSVGSSMEQLLKDGKKSDRGKKLTIYIIFILGGIVATSIPQNNTTGTITRTHVICCLIILIMLWFYILLIYALYKSEEIYRIRVYTQPPTKTAITIPYQVTHYPTIPCGSISEFCAMRGSTYHIILLVTCTSISWLLIGACMMATPMGEMTISEVIKKDMFEIEIPMFFFGNIGLFTIGFWELHPEDIIHVVLHYLGTVGLLMYGIAFCLHTNWSIFSVILLVLGMFFWILWICLKSCECVSIVVKESKDAKLVKRSSVILIVVEMLFIWFFFLGGVGFVAGL
eukprot:527133_1